MKETKSYFTVPNNIFELGLSSQELLVLTYFLSVGNNKDKVFVKQSTIANRLGYSTTSTVSKAIKNLENKGFIKTFENYWDNQRTTNSYRLNTSIISANKNFFIVTRDLFSTLSKLNKTSMVAYLYMLKCSNTKTAFPSIAQISKFANISQSSVCNAIKQLSNLGMISRVHQIKKDTSFGHNMYVLKNSIIEIIKHQTIRIKRKTIKLHKKIQHFFSCAVETNIICNFAMFISRYFSSFLRGSPKIKVRATTH